ncbi:hypothetical protein [Streptomyces sp. NRRL S-241]|uniref:hypothetical protein n=1 Tax=Streptomyces sp. NRRL S-241 TaxID=1463896 RepID=UPI0004BEE8A3|nr:hypothetical protein [Streptomyces sp. NRRL S-241]
MTPDRAYTTARQLIDPDADYTVQVRTETGWTQPGDPDHRELPGLDVLLAARRVLRAQPAGRVSSPHPDTLDIHTGDGQLWLRFTTILSTKPSLKPEGSPLSHAEHTAATTLSTPTSHLTAWHHQASDLR